MGDFLKEHDIYVESFATQLNLRFAPPQGLRTHHGGIEEMVELQKEFKIFKKGRPFRTSIAVLNIPAGVGNDVKNRLYEYIDSLKRHESNVPGKNAEEAVIEALLKNFAAKKPLPVYFKYHDMAGEQGDKKVLITPRGRPVTYFDQEYLVLSFPTQQGGLAEAAAAKKGKPAAKKAKTPARKSGKGK
jgi:hypothetical protein